MFLHLECRLGESRTCSRESKPIEILVNTFLLELTGAHVEHFSRIDCFAQREHEGTHRERPTYIVLTPNKSTGRKATTLWVITSWPIAIKGLYFSPANTQVSSIASVPGQTWAVVERDSGTCCGRWVCESGPLVCRLLGSKEFHPPFESIRHR